MDDFSILIGGKAGFGIDKSGMVIGRLLNQLGYRVYIYRDYPSLIRGGHTFSIIRASKNRVSAHKDKIDIIIALNQETLGLHKNRLKKDCFFIFDSEQIKGSSLYTCGIGLPLGKFLKEANAPEIMRNTCIIGALTRAMGINFDILAQVLKKEFTKLINEVNIYGYDLVTALRYMAFNSPSRKLAELYNGLATTITSGGDLPNFFDKRAQTLLFEHRLETEKHSKAAETFMDIYISVVIAAPMILMLLLMMMRLSGLGISLSTGMITLVMVLGVSLMNVLFLSFLHLKQPEGA